MGASVLHEEAIFPVKEANIPIHILNTNRPQDAGTIIQEHSKSRVDTQLQVLPVKRFHVNLHL